TARVKFVLHAVHAAVVLGGGALVWLVLQPGVAQPLRLRRLRRAGGSDGVYALALRRARRDALLWSRPRGAVRVQLAYSFAATMTVVVALTTRISDSRWIGWPEFALVAAVAAIAGAGLASRAFTPVRVGAIAFATEVVLHAGAVVATWVPAYLSGRARSDQLVAAFFCHRAAVPSRTVTAALRTIGVQPPATPTTTAFLSPAALIATVALLAAGAACVQW